MTDESFPQFYTRRTSDLEFPYGLDEFLTPNNEVWPEKSYDYPFAQAPTVSNVPADEWADWEQYVSRYYSANALKFGLESSEFSLDSFVRNGISGYARLSDETFLQLICEGLYSKFLVTLDDRDIKLFGIQPSEFEKYQYLKSDLSCMRVVRKTWDGEFIAPAIVVIRRSKAKSGEALSFAYELVGIALAKRDPDGQYAYSPELVFDAHSPSWWLAKYFALQGAIHRINLIDHIRVHFPSDTINAISKSVLPRWHLVHQLLLPHFWLTLPVNNAVLEGDRSLINRDTWYPWSPLVAKGEEIRRLIPLSWGGASYCWDEPTNAYPAYRFGLEPESLPFIQLQVSRFAKFQRDYYDPILKFTELVLSNLPEPAPAPADDSLEWLELRRWAREISKLVPGFPDEDTIRSKQTLAQVCAMVIWNASIVHTTDHSSLHLMMDTQPVPFILRVQPPASNTAHTTLDDVAKGTDYLHAFAEQLRKLLPAGNLVDTVVDMVQKGLRSMQLSESFAPLCWPGDLVYAKMADLLFYRPHGSSLLYDCEYPFLQANPLDDTWRRAGRPVIDDPTRDRLRAACTAFQKDLLRINATYYDASGAPVSGEPAPTEAPYALNQYGFPKVIPGSNDDAKAARVECCFSSGIQY